MRREGAGTFLIDPVACPDLSALARVLRADEWIVHAASQDLPCLRELGLIGPRLFDTELAARLLGKPKVGLSALVDEELGIHLAKEHSAADWSTRPLPETWLEYAAYDVEYLIPLRRNLAAQLEEAGKTEWAAQEFAFQLGAPPPPARPDRWRRTSRITDARSPRALAVVRALWTVRDQIAKELDKAPGRVLNDRALMAVASRRPLPEKLPATRDFRVRRPLWEQAYAEALTLTDGELPSRRGPGRGGLPDPRQWRTLDPEAASRLAIVRAAVAARAAELALPQENLLSPAAQRLVAWNTADVGETLAGTDARPWQIEQVAGTIREALETDGASLEQAENESGR